jgi:hypothetical protein
MRQAVEPGLEVHHQSARTDADRGAASAAAFIDNRPAAIAQRQMLDMIEQSPSMVSQRARIATINGAPPLQAKLTYGPKPVTDVSELSAVRLSPHGKPASTKEFFNVGAKQWKEKLAGRHRDQGARDAYMQRAFNALKALIGDETHTEAASSPLALKEKVYAYMDGMSKEAAALKTAESSPALSLEADVDDDHDDHDEYDPRAERKDGEGDGIADIARPLYRWLRARKRAFPLDHLEHVARQATVGAPGFVYELELAVSALKQTENAYVQFGALPLSAIELYLAPVGGLANYTQPVKGQVGGDITVWVPKGDAAAQKPSEPATSASPTGHLGADFVQAKAIKFTSINSEVEKATNQLAGQCAHARGDNVRASDRETTLLGEDYVGSIFVKILDGVSDTAVLDRAAKKALGNTFVKWVVFDDAIAGTKHIYPGGHTI